MPNRAAVRYEITFHPDAVKEYEHLDHSVALIVDKKLADLQERAEDIGKSLAGNLSGYREIKLRAAGIRIIYEVSRESPSKGTVYILVIQKRDKNQAFDAAARRSKSR